MGPLGPLELLERGTVTPGVYRLLDYRPAPRLLATVGGWGWHAGYVDGKMVQDKPGFLMAIGAALAFPDYSQGRGFGKNWDALEEMINDLSWLPAPGYVVLYDRVVSFAGTRPGDWQTALSILQAACAAWRRRGIPFFVLLRHSTIWNRHVPKLVTL